MRPNWRWLSVDEHVDEVVDDVDPAQQLLAQLRRELEEHGSLGQDIQELEERGISVEQWRRTARQAARQLERPVQTVLGASSVWAALRDWPATGPEQAHHQAQMRRAVEAAAQVDPDSQ